MKVASFELCRMLYKAAGHSDDWAGTDRWYGVIKDAPDLGHMPLDCSNYPDGGIDWDCPAYDLGYLIRNLPRLQREHASLILYYDYEFGEWVAEYAVRGDQKASSEGHAAKSEDAVAHLAINLIKHGVINPRKEGDGASN